MTTSPQHNVRLCLPGRHHLYAQVNVRARVVLSSQEQTFEFFGDYEPNLQIVDVECVDCDLCVPAGGQLPADVHETIAQALEEAFIMAPLDDTGTM